MFILQNMNCLLSEKDELDAIFPNDIQCFIYPNEELEKMHVI